MAKVVNRPLHMKEAIGINIWPKLKEAEALMAM